MMQLTGKCLLLISAHSLPASHFSIAEVQYLRAKKGIILLS